jgi:hypothetical protein
MRRTLPAATLVMALAVAGCSSSTSGGGTTPSSAPGTTALASAPTGGPTPCCAGPSSGAASSESQSSGGGTLTQQQAQDALLSASDLGSTFSEQPSDDSPSPLPCRPNDPPIDEQVPPQVKAVASFANTAGTALLQEEIDGYKDVTTTQRVLALGEDGLSCSHATIPSGNGTINVKLTGPIDLTSQLSVKADKVDGWQVSGAGVQLVLIAAQLGSQLVVMTFTASKKLDTSTLPNTQTIVEKALKKVEAVQ